MLPSVSVSQITTLRSSFADVRDYAAVGPDGELKLEDDAEALELRCS